MDKTRAVLLNKVNLYGCVHQVMALLRWETST
jgi:hypothetical protein